MSRMVNPDPRSHALSDAQRSHDEGLAAIAFAIVYLADVLAKTGEDQ